jgi:hypothetical protein
VKQYRVMMRRRVMVNTDSQRRCYDGCNFSEELQWTPWEEVDYCIPEDRIARRLEFWRELNDYAISQRGEIARAEHRAEEVT